MSNNVLSVEEKSAQVEGQVTELLERVRDAVLLKARVVLQDPRVKRDPVLMGDNYILVKLLITAYFEELRPYALPHDWYRRELDAVKALV